MKRNAHIEAMCKAFWNAYRDGFLSVGGSKDYPTWDEFAEAKAKDETRRCMRHAVEELNGRVTHFTDLFPDKPVRRKTFERTQAEVQAESLNLAVQTNA